MDNVSNPKGKSAAHRSFSKKKNPAIDRLNTRQHGEMSLASEEGYDRMRDDRLVKYGIGHDGSDRKSTPSRSSGKKTKGKTNYQKQAEKEHGKGVTALDIVKKNIEKKHGKGAIMSTKKEGYVPLKSFKQVTEAAPLAAVVPVAAKAAKVAAVGAKAGATAAKAGAASAKAAGSAAGATKAVGGAAAKQASVAGTTAGSSAKTAGFGQKLKSAAIDGAKAGAVDAAGDHARSAVRKAAGPKDDTREETLHELSSDTLQKASKAADIDRGKKAVAGDKEGAAKKSAQAVRLYKAQAKKRLNKEETDILNDLSESGLFSDDEIETILNMNEED